MDYIEDLRKRLPEQKNIEGFPLGEDEDIINLSNPPYYTACPNPYIEEFIEQNGTKYDEANDNYNRTPYIDDLDTRKNDALSNAHSYHTKSPFNAIKQYIEYYTKPGDIILDVFSGSGMSGIAAHKSKRKAILCDLSPIASFLTHNYSSSADPFDFHNTGIEIINKIKEKTDYLFYTNHKNNNKGFINSVLYSQIFRCPICDTEYNLWDYAANHKDGQLMDEYSCKSCNAIINKKDSKKVFIKRFDFGLNKEIELLKNKPVEIVYTYAGKRYKKVPDENDISLIEAANNYKIPFWYPTDAIPDGDEIKRLKKSLSIENVHHLFEKRTLIVLSHLFNEINIVSNVDIKNKLLITFNSLLLRASKKAILHVSNYFHGGGGYISTISGNWYVPSLYFEVPVMEQFENRISKINNINKSLFKKENVIVSTQSATDLSNIPSNSIDFIFIDPPFGANLMYSELNFLYECWLKFLTNTKEEAIINKSQNKEIDEYGDLILGSLSELFRVLKPRRWLTLEFHSSKSSIWNIIQSSINKSGFILSHTSILKNKGKSFVINVAPNAVSNDLILHLYKPSANFIKQVKSNNGEGLEVNYINEFLNSLTVKHSIERTEKMLFSKYISYYLKNGYEISMDANVFYNMLSNNFINEDGFWFNSNQINSYLEYKKKEKLNGIEHIKSDVLSLFISDEKSALIWLYGFLSNPKSFSDIVTEFTQLANIQDDEVPELLTLLEDNFMKENNNYRRPGSEEEHSSIVLKREKVLMREFEGLLLKSNTEKAKIKSVRKEALLFGFEVCYKNKRFKDIIALSERLDNSIIENTSEINDFVEAAKIMVEGIS